LLAARAAWREGDFEEAARHLQDCQDLEGKASADSVLEWSLAHAAGGDLDRAEEPLKAQAQRDPTLATLIVEALIQGYLRTARLDEALHRADEWVQREPDNVQAHYLRGNISRRMGWSSEAAANYGRVVELDPDHPQARSGLVIALVDTGRYEEALQHLEALAQHHPLDVEMQVRLAICRYRLGHSREARTILDGILAEHPDNGLALLTRGQIAQAAGQLPEAEDWLSRAVRVMPNDYKAHWSLCKCLRQQGKAEADVEQKRTEALRGRWERYNELTTHLLAQRPNDPALQCELGKLMLELGLPEAGRNWLLGALRLDEHYLPALTALADYYQQQGDTNAAQDYRRRAASSAPP
jgi:predicted Zn-dependent protease